jgi:hypothetical protein
MTFPQARPVKHLAKVRILSQIVQRENEKSHMKYSLSNRAWTGETLVPFPLEPGKNLHSIIALQLLMFSKNPNYT